MIARTSACKPESPVCCISTETAILPENSTVFPGAAILPNTPCHTSLPHRARIPSAEPPQAEYDRRPRRYWSLSLANAETPIEITAQTEREEQLATNLALFSAILRGRNRGFSRPLRRLAAKSRRTIAHIRLLGGSFRWAPVAKLQGVRCRVPAPDQRTTTDTYQTNGRVSVAVR
jgi:hypothetical protein